MKKSIIAAGALALIATAGANAADLVTYQQQPVTAAAPVATAIDWNGVYIGGMIGGSWADADTKIKEGKEKLAKKNVSPDSFIGGLYAGYNFQPNFLANSFLKDIVLGVETDFLFNSGDGSGNKVYTDEDGDKWTYRASVRQKWNGATRLRAGYALGSEGRFLPYLAGGVSYADIRAQARYADGDVKGKGRNVEWDRYSRTKSVAGWNIGAGIDYVPPILNDHLVLRAEYRFTDFGSQTFSKDKDEDGVARQKVDFSQNDFRIGVAYKF